MAVAVVQLVGIGRTVCCTRQPGLGKRRGRAPGTRTYPGAALLHLSGCPRGLGTGCA